jgi:Icc-related predicted phosphoesterase
MKLLLFSDIHADWLALEALMQREADYFFCAGDLVSWSRSLDRAGKILSQRAGRVFAIPGNHESLGDIELMSEPFGVRSVHDQTWMLDGIRFGALGYSNPTPFQTPGEASEGDLERALTAMAEFNPEVLVCHCPPKNTILDRAGEGRHYGSTGIAAALEILAPRYFFCGHIHEAEGQSGPIGPGGRTMGVNLGKRGYLLDLEALQAA